MARRLRKRLAKCVKCARIHTVMVRTMLDGKLMWTRICPGCQHMIQAQNLRAQAKRHEDMAAAWFVSEMAACRSRRWSKGKVGHSE